MRITSLEWTAAWSVLAAALSGCLVLAGEGKDTFSQLPENVFNSIKCVPYAYGDFNADKRVDIFCVSMAGLQVEIWLAQEKEPLFIQYGVYNKLRNDSSVIVNLVPGDFNGDSTMDLLVVFNTGAAYQMSLLIGSKIAKYSNDLSQANQNQLPYNITDQPFTADINGDGKIDLLFETKDSGTLKRMVVSFNQFGLIEKSDEMPSNSVLFAGYAHSISDMNNDYYQDLMLTVHPKSGSVAQQPSFEMHSIDSDTNTYAVVSDNYDAPPGCAIYGQSLFADFDSDGVIEHMIPACKDAACQNSAIFVRKNTTWYELPIDFGLYGFVPPAQAQEFWGANSISLKAGDYNLNGYIDLMAVLKAKNGSNSNERYAILMNNIENRNAVFRRTFRLDSHILTLFSHNNVAQASFFDLSDDGYLDILLVVKDSTDAQNPVYQLIALQNEYYDDVYFLKVMVIPGRCSVSMCPFQTLPYGLNYPGALVKIESTSFEYEHIAIYATQLSQSSYMSLQLPYTIFGLGATPNFVEYLTVGITSVTASSVIRGYKKEWPQIIPNSQLVINPNPRDYTYSWKMQLFITPSKNILMTAISLGSTMVGLIIVICFLQFREKKMDEKERKLESQRFHFDGL